GIVALAQAIYDHRISTVCRNWRMPLNRPAAATPTLWPTAGGWGLTSRVADWLTFSWGRCDYATKSRTLESCGSRRRAAFVECALVRTHNSEQPMVRSSWPLRLRGIREEPSSHKRILYAAYTLCGPTEHRPSRRHADRT